MSILTNPARFRRTAAGLALIVGSLMFLVADAVRPASSDDPATYVGEVAASPGATAATGVLQVLGFAIFVVGIVGIVHLIRGRGVTLAHIGGALALVGLGAFPALGMLGVVDAIAAESISPAAHVALIEDGFESNAAALVVLVVSLAGALLGAILIGAAVWRSGLAPWWAGAAIIAGAVLFAGAPGTVLFLIGDVLHLIAFGYIGIRMLRMSDSEWEHPAADWRNSAGRTAVEARREPAGGGGLVESVAG